MPAARRSLQIDAVTDLVEAHLHADVSIDEVGLELEWLVSDATDRRRRPGHDELAAIVDGIGALPGGGRVMIEPGGQLELATRPHGSIDELCEAAADDLYRLERATDAADLELIALGADPVRAPRRITTAPRYRAMEEHFDRRSAAGRTMMCNTASIQLNVGRGTDAEVERRWRRANQLGPVLIAAFANSPFGVDGATGWASTRLRAWWQIDPTRTAPVVHRDGLVADWARYVLDAAVMLVRTDDDRYDVLDRPISMAEWVQQGHAIGWPDADDLAYHLTTLFPPVRPRGWLELRMFDALPTPFWHVAVAVATALLDDADDETLADALRGTEDLWTDAAQLGLGHPALARAAQRCFALARSLLADAGADQGIQAVVASYDERWIQQGRCPADDALATFRATGDPYPLPVSPVPFADLIHAVR